MFGLSNTLGCILLIQVCKSFLSLRFWKKISFETNCFFQQLFLDFGLFVVLAHIFLRSNHLNTEPLNDWFWQLCILEGQISTHSLSGLAETTINVNFQVCLF